MFVVSANYLNRKSPIKWLVREEDESVDEVQEVEMVVAGGVKFTQSTEVESGFGCGRIAKCVSVVTAPPKSLLVGREPNKMTFDGYDFIGMYGEKIEEVEVMILDVDGGMYYL
jgi:hypothetical protein